MKSRHAITLSSDLKSKYKSRRVSKQDMGLQHSIIQVHYISNRSGALGREVLPAASTKDRNLRQKAVLHGLYALAIRQGLLKLKRMVVCTLWEILKISFALYVNSNK